MNSFISRVSSANQMKDALDLQSLQGRAIADRVSKASLRNQDGFALPSNSMPAPGTAGPVTVPTPTVPGIPDASGTGANGDVNIEDEMTQLADNQIRYEATTKLLSKTYAQVRSSLRDH